MYEVTKTIEISGSHCLQLDYDSKCLNEHGHNWIINITCKSTELNKNGMVIDFKDIKDIVMKLDHKFLNDIVSFNPTAENLAFYLWSKIPYCFKVEVIESRDNKAVYSGIKKECFLHD